MKYFLAVLLILCSKTIFAQDFTANNIDPKLKENAYAVIRKDDRFVEIHSHTKIDYTRELIITVFDQSGDDYAQAYQYYNPRTKIVSLDAVYYDQYGKEIKKFKTRDFEDQSAVGGGQMYTDSRVKFLRYNPTQYPYTLHYKVKVNHTDYSYPTSWFPIQASNVAIENATFILKNNTTASMQISEKNFEHFPIQKQNTAQQISYTLNHQKALEDEQMMPFYRDVFPHAEINISEFVLDGVAGKFNDWNGLGIWYNKLISNVNDFTPKEKQYFKDMVKDAESDREKVKILYKHLQNKTRYIGVQLGIGGLKPFPSSYVESKSYGDCKALTNYMQSMLEAVGIKSYYTIVESGRDGYNFDENFASLGQGDHVILYVPLAEEDIWLEATSQTTAFNYLGHFTHDRKVAIVTEKGAKIINTQVFPTEKNSLKTLGIAKIDEQGKLSLSYTETAAGLQYDDVYQLKNYKESDQKIIYQKKFYYLPNLQLKNYTYLNNWDEAKFTSVVNLDVNQFGQIQGKNLIVNVIPVNRQSNDLKRAKKRLFDLYIHDTFVDEVEYTLEIPEAYQTNLNFEPVEFSSEFGQYSLKIIPAEDNQILVKRKYVQQKGRFSKEKYNEYVEFRRKVESNDNTKILFEKI